MEACDGDRDALPFEMVSLRELDSTDIAMHCIATMNTPVVRASPPTKLGLNVRARSCSTLRNVGRCAGVFPHDDGTGGGEEEGAGRVDAVQRHCNDQHQNV